jgi:hypothetical protein
MPHSQALDKASKACQETNTLAYLFESVSDEVKTVVSIDSKSQN